MCHMWKFATHWSIMTLSFEVIISIGFWSFCYDAPKEPGLQEVNLIMDHSVPIILLSIDFALNRIYHEVNQLWINIWVLLVYGVINYVYTVVTGTPVYPPITWDSVTSVSLAASAVPLYMLFWLMLSLFNDCKFKNYEVKGDNVGELGTMEEDEIPTFDNRTNPEDLPFLNNNDKS